jgi:hypothetical protein
MLGTDSVVGQSISCYRIIEKLGGMGVLLQKLELLAQYRVSLAILTWRNMAISPIGIACCCRCLGTDLRQ